jgi:hypothetical protein
MNIEKILQKTTLVKTLDTASYQSARQVSTNYRVLTCLNVCLHGQIIFTLKPLFFVNKYGKVIAKPSMIRLPQI